MSKTVSLLIDGEWNLKRNYIEREKLFAAGEFCGGSYGFIDSLRSVMNKTMPDRVVVFWDGDMAGIMRKRIYPLYKANRNKSWDEDSYIWTDDLINEEKKRKHSILQQKIKVKNYLEEFFVRQIEVKEIEADDLIALYVKEKKEDEEIIIFSSDKDYLTIIEDKVSVLVPSDGMLVNKATFNGTRGYIHENYLLIRCFEGDKSDNISGVEGVGMKRLLEIFPNMKNEVYTINRVIEEANDLLVNGKTGKTIKRIAESKKIVERNYDLMNLKSPFINQIATDELKEIRDCVLIDSEDDNSRSINNAMNMLVKDGYVNLLYNGDVQLFVRPFYRLMNKEKEYYRKMANENNN